MAKKKPETSPIKHVVFDADNTLWDWVGMHLPGLETIVECLATAGLNMTPSEIRASMFEVYSNWGTLDYTPLIQEMKVLQIKLHRHLLELLLQHAGETEEFKKIAGLISAEDAFELVQDPDAFEAKLVTMQQEKVVGPEAYRRVVSDLMRDNDDLTEALIQATRKEDDILQAVKEAYSDVRDTTLKAYPGVSQVLQRLREAEIKAYILTDAPLSRTIRRAGRCKIRSHFTKVFGQADELSEKLPHFKKHRTKRGAYKVVEFTPLELEQRKPEIDIGKLLGLTKKEVTDQVAVVGDNMAKDIGLAHFNNCQGFHAAYGKPSDEQVQRLLQFGPPAVVGRNVDFSQDVVNIIQNTRLTVLEKSILEILPHLGLEAAA